MNQTLAQKPQIWWAVYDTSADSDFYPFDTQTEAVAEVERWIANGIVEELTEEWGATWGRIYVCSADADTVPDIDDPAGDDWSLWDYEDSAINTRTMFSSWGAHKLENINP
jgi:hypothetical protein